MDSHDDAELLRRFAEAGTQSAFDEIVRRRVGLVYSVALRRIGDAQRAEDATQVVFLQLVRNAAKLAKQPVLIGWFYRAAYNAATDMVRSERARMAREQEHFTMTEQLSSPAPDWSELRPTLDAALQELNDDDRNAVLLRFFDDLSFTAIGERLHLTENTARMRVHRALERLHSVLLRRGVSSTAAMIGGAFAAQATAAVPSGLAEKVAAAVLAAKPAAVLTGTLVTMKTLKLTAAAAALFIAATATIVAMRKSDLPPDEKRAAVVAQRPNETTTPSPSPAARLATDQSPNATSTFQGGALVSAADMTNRGNATPRDALETFIWAQEGGELSTLTDLIFLTPEARKRAEKLFASLPEVQRAQFGTPERLMAAFMSGGEAVLNGGKPTQPKWYYHEIVDDHEGAKFPADAKLLPSVFGVEQSAATDPNYRTFLTRRRSSPQGKGYEPNWVFRRTDIGWKWMMDASMVDMFSRALARNASSAAGKQ